MSSKKKVIVAILSTIVVFAVAISGTYAILSAKTNRLENKFEHGVVNVEIVETEFTGEPVEGTEDTYVKKVKVVNDSKQNQLNVVNEYVMAKLVANWVNDNQEIYMVDVEYELLGMSEDWVSGQQAGEYYYIHVLEKDQESSYLMEGIKILNLDELPQDGHLELNVLTQAIQANRFEDYLSAWAATKK